MKKILVVVSLIVLTITTTSAVSPANHAQLKQPDTMFVDWYLIGYGDGYDDAINNRPWGYSAERRLIPEWYHTLYMEGYNDGWNAGQ